MKAALQNNILLLLLLLLAAQTETRRVESNQRLESHYDEKETLNSAQCFDLCDADNAKCAAASFTQPAQCRLLKYGFKQIRGSSGSTAYIKPDVRTAMADTGLEALNNDFPVVKQFKRLFGHYANFDTMTPAQCFDACKTSTDCGGATFTIDRMWLFNCYLCHPGQFTESNEQNAKENQADLWTSYVKSSVNTFSASRDDDSREVEESLRLIGHYAEHKTSSDEECFAKCDKDSKCAAACLTLPDECRLFKYGFEEVPESSGSTTYIKSEVKKEMTNIDKLNEKYPLVRQNKRLFGHYQQFDVLTPSQCFKTCKASLQCGGATFTVDRHWLFNCFICHPDEFTESTDPNDKETKPYLWTSYTKARSETTPSPVAVTTDTTKISTKSPAATNTAQRQYVQPNTALVGQNFPSKSATADLCFDECDSSQTWAAACFIATPPKCLLFKYGFEQRFAITGSTSFVKPEVTEDMVNMDKLNDKFPIVKQNVKLINHYDNFDTLTPSLCFSTCKMSVRCAAASFTTDIRWSKNCFLFKRGEYFESNEDLEFWITYTKVSPFPSQVPGQIVTINNIHDNTIGSNNAQTLNSNSGNVDFTHGNVKLTGGNVRHIK